MVLDGIKLENGQCPAGYERCSSQENKIDSVCVKEGERKSSCPILDLIITHED